MTAAPPVVGNYTLTERIDPPGEANLYLAKHNITGLAVSLRRYSREDPEEMLAFQRESTGLRTVFHPFIVGFYEVIEAGPYMFTALEWPERGSLFDLIHKQGAMAEAPAKVFLMQMVCAFEYLHYVKGMIFRNLRTENVRLDSHQNIRIGNFSRCKLVSPQERLYNSIPEAPTYSAPEVLLDQPVTKSSDIWSLGVVLFALTIGRLPFEDPNQGRLFRKVTSEDPVFPVSISPMLTDLLQRMLTKDASLRITLEAIKQHPWLAQGSDEPILAFDLSSVETLRLSRDPMLVAAFDPEIEGELIGMGLDPTDLKAKFMSDERTVETVSYSQLLRRKMVDELAEIVGDHSARSSEVSGAADIGNGRKLKFAPSSLRSWMRPRDVFSQGAAGPRMPAARLRRVNRQRSQSPEPK
jgi:serine/threonine protein kinase